MNTRHYPSGLPQHAGTRPRTTLRAGRPAILVISLTTLLAVSGLALSTQARSPYNLLVLGLAGAASLALPPLLFMRRVQASAKTTPAKPTPAWRKGGRERKGLPSTSTPPANPAATSLPARAALDASPVRTGAPPGNHAYTPTLAEELLADVREIDEAGTKLDLGKLFITIGNKADGLSLLHEVLQEGNSAQRRQAADLLEHFLKSNCPA